MRGRCHGKEGVWAEFRHHRAANRRTDDGTDAVEQQQTTGHLDEFVCAGEVVGMGNRDRVERIGGGAVNRDQHDHGQRVGRLQHDQRQGRQRRERRERRQDIAPVRPVGGLAGRKLHQRADEDGDRQHDGDHVWRQACAGAEHGAERTIGAIGDADEQDADEGDRRVAIEPP